MAAVCYFSEKSSVDHERDSIDGRLSELPKSPSTATLELGDTSAKESKHRTSILERVKKFGAIGAFVFLSLFSLTVKDLVYVRLTFVKACVNEVGLSYDECVLLDENSEEFKEADKIASWYIMVSRWVSSGSSLVMGILMGTFCDKYQVKIPLLIASSGFVIESALSLFSAVFIASPLFIIVFSKAPASLLGGSIAVLTGSNAYIRRVTTPKARQITFATLQVLILAGITLGTVAGGFLFQEGNYVAVYSVSVVANVVSIIVLVLLVEDKDPKTKSMTYEEVAKAFFSIDCLKDCYHLVVAPREGNRRAQIWLLLISSFVTAVPLTGTRSLLLLYVKKRYSWDTETTAYIIGALRLGVACVTIAGIRVFSKRMKLRDPIVALIGLSSLTADFLCRGVATSGLMFSLSHIIGALSGCANSASSNLLNRLLNENELGKVFVFRSLIDLSSSAAGASFFSMIYRESKSTLPGAMYMSAAVWTAVPMFIMLWILYCGTPPAPRSETSDSSVDLVNKYASDA